MSPDQMQRVLHTHVDRVVRVRWYNDQRQLAKVISADMEGFVYDFVPPDPKTPYWSSYGSMLEVHPHHEFE